MRVAFTNRPAGHRVRERLFAAFLSALTCCAVLAPALSSPAADEAVATVTNVVVAGNQRVPVATIRAVLRTVVGGGFSPAVISDDVRAIHRLGYFQDVRVDSEGFEGGLAVTFTVREKPIINRIEFRGNTEVKTEDLRERVTLKTKAVLNEAEVRAAVDAIRALLNEKSFYLGTVDYRLEETSPGEVTVVFLVAEGEELYVREILFRGNREVESDDLRDVMETKEKGLLSFLTKSGVLVSRQLEDDAVRLRAHLYNNGYMTARVEDPVVEVDRAARSLRVTINLVEGPQFRVGSVTADGDDVFTPEKILSVVSTRPGDIFRRDRFAQDLTAVQLLYTDLGYAYCEPDARTATAEGGATVDLRIIVNRGQRVRVGRISISGNRLTRDNVIRREIVLTEGEYFSSKGLSRSRQKITNLGFFEKVEIDVQKRTPEVIDISFNVTEKLTGAVTFGVGYSSEEKFGGSFKLSEDNFFGWGHRVQAEVDYSSTRRQFSLSYSVPSIWDSPYSLGMRGYNQRAEYDEYDRKTVGGSITLGRALGEYGRGNFTFKNDDVTLLEINDTASDLIKEQEGEHLTRSLVLTYLRDSRDNFFTPTTGNSSQLRVEYAGGFLSGDNYFVRYEAETGSFYPLFWKVVLMLHGEGGLIKGFDGHEVPLYERYYLGGINSLRGYQSRSVGPKDENGDPIGGTSKLLFNAEILFPLIPEQGVRGVIFYDAGQAFDDGEPVTLDALHHSWGVGFRWYSPIGPFRIEWGQALDPIEGDPKSDWQFSIGTFF